MTRDGQVISEPRVLIETRGTGGYVAAPGSHPSVHRVGTPYKLIHGKQENLPQITDQEAGYPAEHLPKLQPV